jgi:hypothetical protein
MTRTYQKCSTPSRTGATLKRVYKEVTATFDQTQQDSMLWSGRNSSDGEGETNDNIVTITKNQRHTFSIGISLPTRTQSASAK